MRFISRDTIGIWGDQMELGNGYAYAAAQAYRVNDPMGEGFWKKVRSATKRVKEAAKDVADLAEDVLDAGADALAEAGEAVMEAGKDATNTVAEIATDVADAVSEKAENLADLTQEALTKSSGPATAAASVVAPTAKSREESIEARDAGWTFTVKALLVTATFGDKGVQVGLDLVGPGVTATFSPQGQTADAFGYCGGGGFLGPGGSGNVHLYNKTEGWKDPRGSNENWGEFGIGLEGPGITCGLTSDVRPYPWS